MSDSKSLEVQMALVSQQLEAITKSVSKNEEHYAELSNKYQALNNKLSWLNGGLALLGVVFPIFLFIGNDWRNAIDQDATQLQHRVSAIENRVIKPEYNIKENKSRD